MVPANQEQPNQLNQLNQLNQSNQSNELEAVERAEVVGQLAVREQDGPKVNPQVQKQELHELRRINCQSVA
jgi:hypothetical protein